MTSDINSIINKECTITEKYQEWTKVIMYKQLKCIKLQNMALGTVIGQFTTRENHKLANKLH